MISAPSPPPLPQAPAPPPNPPMFGSQATRGAGQRQQQRAGMNQGFGATVLGTGNPTNTGFKTLLGQ